MPNEGAHRRDAQWRGIITSGKKLRRENVTHRRTGSEQAKLGENIHHSLAHCKVAVFFPGSTNASSETTTLVSETRNSLLRKPKHILRELYSSEYKTLSSGTAPTRLQKCQTLFCRNGMITWHIGELHFSCHIKIAARVFLPFSSLFFISVMFSGPQPHSTLQHWFGNLMKSCREGGRADKNNRTKVCASV